MFYNIERNKTANLHSISLNDNNFNVGTLHTKRCYLRSNTNIPTIDSRVLSFSIYDLLPEQIMGIVEINLGTMSVCITGYDIQNDNGIVGYVSAYNPLVAEVTIRKEYAYITVLYTD